MALPGNSYCPSCRSGNNKVTPSLSTSLCPHSFLSSTILVTLLLLLPLIVPSASSLHSQWQPLKAYVKGPALSSHIKEPSNNSSIVFFCSPLSLFLPPSLPSLPSLSSLSSLSLFLPSLPLSSYSSSQVAFVPAVAIQRALEQLIVKCPHSCGNEGSLKRGQLKTHLLSCTKRPLPCPCPTCLGLLSRGGMRGEVRR